MAASGCSRLLDALKRHRKTTVFIGIVGVLWCLLFFPLWLSSSAPCDLRPWLELANGATWPGDWQKVSQNTPFWFAVTLATRTVLNFSVAIAVIGGAVWFLLGGLERYMHMTVLDLLRLHNVELVSCLAGLLKKLHPDVITSKDVDAMEAEARRFLNEWQTELKHIAREEVPSDA